jgi:hypothetical protein
MKRAVDRKLPPCKNVCGCCGGTHPWPEDKCYHKKDAKDGQSGNEKKGEHKYDKCVRFEARQLASRLLTKVLKKEVTSSASKGHNDSDDDKDMTKNDAFMTQMQDKLETCSLNSDSSKQSSDYLEAYTFRPLQEEGTPDSRQ